VLGYGAPAKGTVRLNYCGIGTDLLPEVVDSTPAKQGRHIPGTHQFIRPPSALQEIDPDYVLLLAWNHAPEILQREADFLRRGGKFLTPWLEELRQPS
jgi:methylation protein EvaC